MIDERKCRSFICNKQQSNIQEPYKCKRLFTVGGLIREDWRREVSEWESGRSKEVEVFFRVSICDLEAFSVAGMGNDCWWTRDGTPRSDWAVGRDVWWLFGVEGIFSLIVIEGFGWYKQDGSISFPLKRKKWMEMKEFNRT